MDANNSKTKRTGKTVGMVNGSVSVVHQLHALVTRKCLKIDARVVCVEEVPRVVILVDVYVPIQVWSGWQFPKSGSVAAAILSHLRCDWGERSSILSFPDYYRKTHGENESIWNLSDCHVLGCKLHSHAECLPHPLYVALSTNDGFSFHVNSVSGEIVTGEAPNIKDFRGGMFCGEHGLV